MFRAQQNGFDDAVGKLPSTRDPGSHLQSPSESNRREPHLRELGIHIGTYEREHHDAGSKWHTEKTKDVCDRVGAEDSGYAIALHTLAGECGLITFCLGPKMRLPR